MCLDECGWAPHHYSTYHKEEETTALLLSYDANLIAR